MSKMRQVLTAPTPIRMTSRRFHRAFAILAFAILCPVALRAQAPLGTWQLLSRTDSSAAGIRPADGPLGADPVAWISYDAKGHVSAQLMARDRSKPAPTAGTSTPRDPNNSAASGGYDAYFGTYTLDPATHTVTHHLLGALSPSDVGRTLTRHFRVTGDTLLIWFDAQRDDGAKVTRRLLWQRIAP